MNLPEQERTEHLHARNASLPDDPERPSREEYEQGPDAPSATPAIEPQRVIVLNDDEQHQLVTGQERIGTAQAFALAERVTHGDRYLNATDEFARLSLRKRRLEEEVRRTTARLDAIEPLLIEQWLTDGQTGTTHAATGVKLRLDRRMFARVKVDTDGMDREVAICVRAEAKAKVAEVLLQIDELADLSRHDFNLNSLTGRFRPLMKEYDAAQRELPEHERTPLDVQTLLPDPLRDLIVLDTSPRVLMTKGR